MSNRCSVCAHPSLADIDRDLEAGVPYRALAAQNGLSRSALQRHLKHLARRLAQERWHAHLAHQAALLEKLETLEVRLDRLFHTASDFRLPHVALGCLRESLRLLSLKEKLRLHREGQP